MMAIGEAYELERILSKIYKAEAWLVDDIGRTFPVRLFRQARRGGAEPVLDAVFSGMDRVLRTETRLPEIMLKFDKAFERAMRPQAKHAGALKMLEKQRASWQSIKTTLQSKDRAATEDLVAWVDRDIEERMAIARKLGGGRSTAGGAAKKTAAPGATAVMRGLKAAEKEAAAAAAKRAEQAREVYEAFVAAAARSKPADFPAFNRFAAYFKHDDPIWERIAEKIASHRAGKNTGDVVQAIQGVIGEALALRNAWVVDSIVKATERAHRIASKVGNGWEVVLTQAPVFATTKTGGMGEIYDASIWIVKKGGALAGVLDAAPVFVLQVKSGTTREAAEQIGKDFGRELGEKVRLPAVGEAGVGAGKSATKDYRINNLRKLLSEVGVKEAPGSVGALTTQRMLVSPRAPSTKSILDNLPTGTTVEYVEGLMTKREVNAISGSIRDRLKKK